ncbi:MAG: RBBP9/YdeN family alpha/beta hydrolase [Vitreoscilla sp.]
MTLHDPCRAAAPGVHLLVLPGWQNSGPSHWQTRWEALYGDVRVEQSDWMHPLRGDWMMRLDEAIGELEAREASPQVALVAHSLGCHLVSAWAKHSRKTGRVRAALLVAPPDVERDEVRGVLHSFVPIVRERLPFPSLAVISTDDPFCDLELARTMALDWGAQVLEVGKRGHLNSDSGLGDWPEGRQVLADLLAGR